LPGENLRGKPVRNAQARDGFRLLCLSALSIFDNRILFVSGANYAILRNEANPAESPYESANYSRFSPRWHTRTAWSNPNQRPNTAAYQTDLWKPQVFSQSARDVITKRTGTCAIAMFFNALQPGCARCVTLAMRCPPPLTLTLEE